MFDYLFLSLLLFIAGILVIPLYATVVAVIAFYENEQFKSMIKVVKDNIKNIIILSILGLFLGLMILLLLQIHETGILYWFNRFVLVLLGFSILSLVMFPPIILVKMRVTFKELIRNTLYLMLIQYKSTALMLLLSILMIYLSIYAIWALILVVPWLQSISFISNQALQIEKDKREKGEKI